MSFAQLISVQVLLLCTGGTDRPGEVSDSPLVLIKARAILARVSERLCRGQGLLLWSNTGSCVARHAAAPLVAASLDDLSAVDRQRGSLMAIP